jgi:uncharacterized membrane protein
MSTVRQSFWEVMKTHEEIKEHLADQKTTLSKVKHGERGFSPELARKIAAKTGESAAALYLTSQLASMEKRAATKSMSEAGFMASGQRVITAVTKKFTAREMAEARKDKEFISAAKRLREMLLKALDLIDADAGSGNDAGVVRATGDSVAPALKSRDAFGKAIPDTGDKIERDGHGRRVN